MPISGTYMPERPIAIAALAKGWPKRGVRVAITLPFYLVTQI